MKLGPIYEVAKDLGALAGLGWLIKTLFSAFAKRVTRRERELLAAALSSKDGYVWHNNYPNAGHIWIRAGTLDLGDSCVPEAELIDAFESLIQRGYLRHSTGNLYTLSGRGLKAAKAAAKKIKLTEIPCEQNSSKVTARGMLAGPGGTVC